jgi:hypothetical protein
LRTGRKRNEKFLFLHTKKDLVYEMSTQLPGQMLTPLRFLSSYLQQEKTIHTKESDIRTRLLQGRKTGDDRNLMLFLNDSALGNSTKGGSCSMDYFFNNSNIGNHDHLINNNLQTIFEIHGLAPYATQFVPRLNKLAQEYVEKVSKYGTLYQLAIPKHNVHHNVVPVKTGGFLRQLSVAGEKTSDMQKIAPALVSPSYVEPTDTKEYVLLMTQDPDGGNNPDSGIRVIPHIIAQSQEVLDAWKKEWDATLDELAHAVQQDQEQLPVNQHRATLRTLRSNERLKTIGVAHTIKGRLATRQQH